jgi:hypothetical protein
MGVVKLAGADCISGAVQGELFNHSEFQSLHSQIPVISRSKRGGAAQFHELSPD